jgi:hypothetical protein
VKFLAFILHLGLGLSLAAAAECARRYVALEVPIRGYESIAEPRRVKDVYEELMAGHPRSDLAISVSRSQRDTIDILARSNADNLRAFQDSWRILGVVFAMLGSLFGVAALRVGGSNKALQGDGPRPAGSARA